MLTAKELRQKYLDFFVSKGHKIIPSASLIPEHDPTVLFTTAGMHPLVPYLMGEKHPLGKRLVNIQKCIRTTDIDEVGDNRHLTFFEMMGNWSLGDYFKKEAIEWSWEFLTDKKWLGLNPARIYVTVFKGEDGLAGRDEESIKLWQEQFSKAEINAQISDDKGNWTNENVRIFLLSSEDNWWGPAGQTGPCGPCTEMYYDTRPEKSFEKNKHFNQLVNDFRFLEIWNDVFMEFNKTATGEYKPLKQKNVDTGMGVERTLTALNNLNNIFQTELFTPLLNKVEEISKKKYQENEQAFRIIADHLKAATFILGDFKAIRPSNVDQGYVLRRLIRRAIRYGKKLNISNTFTFKVAEAVIDLYKDIYPELRENKEFIINQLILEEEKFQKTIERGLKEFDKIFEDYKKLIQKDTYVYFWDGRKIFDLYQNYGFPYELSLEELKNRNIEIDESKIKAEFIKEQKKHQELSRKGAEKKFKGGLADAGEQTTKLHTATHLLLAALRQVLGPHVQQKGSNITAERLRFDFNHDQKLNSEQIKKIENIVNDKIKEKLPVSFQEMTLEQAKKLGAIGVFEQKYGEKVKVYSIGNFSKEICGGPHVQNTANLGHFKIIKEESSSAGIRRLKAILE